MSYLAISASGSAGRAFNVRLTAVLTTASNCQVWSLMWRLHYVLWDTPRQSKIFLAQTVTGSRRSSGPYFNYFQIL